MSGPVLSLLRIADPPGPWAELGFEVEDGSFELGGVRVELAAPDGGSQANSLDGGSHANSLDGRSHANSLDGRSGIVGWGLQGLDEVDSIDGLLTVSVTQPPPAEVAHQNGAVGIDHVVVTTPDFDRTAAALAGVGLELRRVREAPGGIRQGFRRLGPAILELVEAPGSGDPGAPARFWGLVVIVADLDSLGRRLGSQLGQAKAAVQPGRRIATLRSSADIGPAMAFMTPEPLHA